MAKTMPDATTVAANWASRMAGSGQKMTDGINAVTVAPGQAAAAAKGLWLQNVSQAGDRFASAVSKVSLSEWQQATVAKGVPRVAQGAQAAQSKFAAVMQTWLPRIAQIRSTLRPRGDISANVDRATQFMTAMHAQKGK